MNYVEEVRVAQLKQYQQAFKNLAYVVIGSGLTVAFFIADPDGLTTTAFMGFATLCFVCAWVIDEHSKGIVSGAAELEEGVNPKYEEMLRELQQHHVRKPLWRLLVSSTFSWPPFI